MSDGPHDGLHPLPDEGDRAFHMAHRLERTAEEAGVAEDGRALIQRCHGLAMGPRKARLGQRAPAFLHPGRSALVLLLDAEVTEPRLLAATLLVESEDVALRLPSTELKGQIPAEIVELRDGVPPAGDERLGERLVTADQSVRLAALAERLDHLRHAHLWDDLDRRRAAHREAEAVYHPVAQRTHPTFERRYAWWIRMFGRRHLG